ncbi:sulfate adenylyltransferase [Candidatus Solirubrobacter pratensis]|uniref:sulfate adenylyltransferase n=1 Tax=Candidatus Solirubrobacter pratensis TaxID=1298857 RepID=UPI0006844309|nr:sulfate adenylyltransferase [Candidatus Solirubrobacter pratensis]
MKRLQLSARQSADVELLANGGYAPLSGFMGEADWRSVVETMRLAGGQPWPIPVTLACEYGEVGDAFMLIGAEGTRLGTLLVDEVYERDLLREAELVYRTTDTAHPGVAALLSEPARTLAGRPLVAAMPRHLPAVAPYVLSPADARAAFTERGWRTVVGFQTRNPIHRAHEYLTKAALEIVDGLFVHPIVGETKADDIPPEVRMQCYEVLLRRYYPADRVLLGVNPAAMRYAGPREAVFHALVRRNYGCTHFIVGRDHAGVGTYYGTYDAHAIFDAFVPGELGIEPLFFEHAFWCPITGGMATTKTSPAAPQERIALSGTRLREMLSRGERPPEEFTRAEVADVLSQAYARERIEV